jgi:hypothetical protein
LEDYKGYGRITKRWILGKQVVKIGGRHWSRVTVFGNRL